MADALASGASVRKDVWVQVPSSIPAPVPRWRNWYTRTFEGRMTQVIRVQVPVWAPHLFCWRPGAAATPGRLAQLVEHLVYTEVVTGSSPVPPTKIHARKCLQSVFAAP